MKVIGVGFNKVLDIGSKCPGLSIVSGVARIIAGVAQAAINGVGVLLGRDCGRDLRMAKLHILTGLYEAFCPGSAMISLSHSKCLGGQNNTIETDHPFFHTSPNFPLGSKVSNWIYETRNQVEGLK